jgi:two-component system, chemotaxis family, CheB/CheR fusion protein
VTFPVAGIAASAGGLEAVSELLAALPPDTGIAYVFIQHLDPDHASPLPEILGRRTALQVQTAQDGLEIAPDHVYVIQPNTTLTLVDNHLRVTPRAAGRHMPGDAFFKSLASERGARSISVVLSGGDSDGALGTETVKHSGGFTFAQEPTTARFPDMPRNAIETGCVDFALEPTQIARELARLGTHPYWQTAAPLDRAQDDDGERVDARDEDHLRRIFRRLRSAHGVDFTHYKRSTLTRRLARRMVMRRIDSISDYAALIESDSVEAAKLYQDFLIRVTGFFRDPESFDGLREHVFPGLRGNRSPRDPIRIWVPGCATGEEVYSIAIALVELLGEEGATAGVQLFGTDVSEAAIEEARAGIYLDTIAQEVSEARLARFFVQQDGRFRISKRVRDLCIFARQDITLDPPFSRLDLVSCRNLLIYLDPPAQRRAIQIFHYALRPNGVLMLGPAESVGQADELFDLKDKKCRLYMRRAVPAGTAVDVTASRAPPSYSHSPGVAPTAFFEAESAQREADRLLLARYAPASLLVDEALNILQFRGETSPYLEHASGPPSLNLQRVARTELIAELSAAVQEARETGAETRREGLSLDERRDVRLSVIPLQRFGLERCYLIVFQDGSRPAAGRRVQQAPAPLSESEKDRRLAQAERELNAMRDYLHATMEEHEAVKEELKSAHEEVLSANEGFQSTNEELETSKEELQSTNEELTTTNDELRNRNRELSALNVEVEKARIASDRERSYADAIIETVREPLLVLQHDLTIVRANQAFYFDFKVRPDETIGRLLFEIGDGQWNDATLKSKLDAVLTVNDTMSEVEIEHEFPTIGYRVMCLTARKISPDRDRGQLILLAIQDITDRQATTANLREHNRRKDEFLAMLAHELRNPLTPITHAIHLLQQKGADPASTTIHEMIARQTGRLVHLVDELLDVARIGRGIIELKHERVDLTALVQQSIQASRVRFEQRQHTVSLSLPERPVYIDGDPVRIEQVMANLLENAAKYTDPGGRIGVSLRRDGDDAVIRVRDSGIGIAPEMLDEIFELFAQVDHSLARSGGGLGLGLTVVRRVLDLHGGSIAAYSDGPGKGSEFVVRLPLAAVISEPKSVPDRIETDMAVRGRGRRIVIVDDNKDSAESLALLARLWGHEVALAADGPTALALVRTFQPEIALVDIGMPGMNGYEIAARLRADGWHNDVLLVAITGYGRAEDRNAARAAGFDVHMTKPVAVDALQHLLATGGAKGK